MSGSSSSGHTYSMGEGWVEGRGDLAEFWIFDNNINNIG